MQSSLETWKAACQKYRQVCDSTYTARVEKLIETCKVTTLESLVVRQESKFTKGEDDAKSEAADKCRHYMGSEKYTVNHALLHPHVKDVLDRLVKYKPH